MLPAQKTWARRDESARKEAWAQWALRVPRALREPGGEVRGGGQSVEQDEELWGGQDGEPKAEPGGQVREEEVCS